MAVSHAARAWSVSETSGHEPRLPSRSIAMLLSAVLVLPGLKLRLI